MYVYIFKEIYLKELAHVIMGVQQTSKKPLGYTRRLETWQELMLQI